MNEAGASHLLLCPFHFNFPTVSLLRHVGVGVLMRGLLSVVTEKQTAVMCAFQADSEPRSHRLGSGPPLMQLQKQNLPIGFSFSGSLLAIKPRRVSVNMRTLVISIRGPVDPVHRDSAEKGGTDEESKGKLPT